MKIKRCQLFLPLLLHSSPFLIVSTTSLVLLCPFDITTKHQFDRMLLAMNSSPQTLDIHCNSRREEWLTPLKRLSSMKEVSVTKIEVLSVTFQYGLKWIFFGPSGRTGKHQENADIPYQNFFFAKFIFRWAIAASSFWLAMGPFLLQCFSCQ